MKNTLVINLDRCSGCETCTVACKHANGIDLGEFWCRVKLVGPMGAWPDVEQYWLPRQCQECENAPCMEVCPTGATYRDEEFGLVQINAEECIGCQLCLSACPYGARTFNERLGVVNKCTGCIDRLREGEQPACAHNCCCGARIFGDLDDPESDAAKEIAKYAPECIHRLDDEVGAAPTCVYILSPHIATWQNMA